jgi:capsular polysaccharide transport system permease protein
MMMPDPAKPRLTQVIEQAPPATPLRPLNLSEDESIIGRADPSTASVSDAVKPARLMWRHYLIFISFVIWVVIPVCLVFFYLYTLASDQFASRAAFSIRKEAASSAVSSLLGGLTNISSGTEDENVLFQYMQSQSLVSEIDSQLDLRKIFSRNHSRDPLLTVTPDATIEELVDFWNKMVTPRLEQRSGIISLEVHAFDAQDAFNISTAILKRDSELIESLSRIAQEDTLRYAKDDLATASQRLKESRLQISEFREVSQVIDPRADAQSQMGILGQLEQKLADAMITLDMLSGSVSEKDPRLTQARKVVDVIQGRISKERAANVTQSTDVNGRAISDNLGTYEAMQVDLEFAEKSYVAALASYETAVAEARRKSRYLVAHISPSMPETAEYPRRLVTASVLTIFIFLSWILLLLVAYSIRDRR